MQGGVIVENLVFDHPSRTEDESPSAPTREEQETPMRSVADGSVHVWYLAAP